MTTEEKKGLLSSLFGKKNHTETEPVENTSEPVKNKRTFDEILEITPAVVDNARLELLNILKTMTFDVDVNAKGDTANGIQLEVTGSEDLGLVIGKEGATLNALQYLLSLMLSKKYGKKVYIHIDANAYKEKKLNSLLDAALDAAKVASEENVQIALDPMNAAERRFVHMKLKEQFPTLETFSRGEGKLRHIVVAPKKEETANA